MHPVEVHPMQVHRMYLKSFQMLPNISEYMQKLKSMMNAYVYFHNTKTRICGCNKFWCLLDQNATKILATQIIESLFIFQILEIK